MLLIGIMCYGGHPLVKNESWTRCSAILNGFVMRKPQVLTDYSERWITLAVVAQMLNHWLDSSKDVILLKQCTSLDAQQGLVINQHNHDLKFHRYLVRRKRYLHHYSNTDTLCIINNQHYQIQIAKHSRQFKFFGQFKIVGRLLLAKIGSATVQ